MGKILVLYASTTGNTELMADAIADHLIDSQYEVEIKSFDFDPIDVEDLPKYDAVLIGTHTWDEGSLPYEVEDFYDEIEDVDITDKIFGVFGSADSFYQSYGGAIDLIADRVEKLGANLLPFKLKVDLEPDAKDIEHCQEFSRVVQKALAQGIKTNDSIEK